ncbi:AbiV family abortive infection protein [Thalassospira indica]|uniref:AbiV family abortive infection protein n=1 Tax=Thalassospira indica TaxID=1891279 RepID=A0ABN5NI72_9PROT|nr:AbiV family abortive infection protein [Thalassospira indica]AXO15961.1 AbiV family abortive infection protein [Thalassospira indica]OAZ13520.1 hypothetical protein TH15_10840 [Thalassospira profundimaris]
MVTKGKPEEFRGTLSPSTAAEGINAAFRNARRLLDDAKLLFSEMRYPTASSIAALAIEEAGKSSIIRSIVLAGDAPEVSKEWKRYRDHRSKNGAWILPSLAKDGGRYLKDFSSVVDRNGEHTVLLNSVKQLGLYTDCYGNSHWSEPEKVIDRELAGQLIHTAELLCIKRDVTVREIELWIEYIQPVNGTSKMAQGLIQWAEKMHEEGLSETTPEDFMQFVLGEWSS